VADIFSGNITGDNTLSPSPERKDRVSSEYRRTICESAERQIKNKRE
jgi:hypothetical protein